MKKIYQLKKKGHTVDYVLASSQLEVFLSSMIKSEESHLYDAYRVKNITPDHAKEAWYLLMGVKGRSEFNHLVDSLEDIKKNPLIIINSEKVDVLYIANQIERLSIYAKKTFEKNAQRKGCFVLIGQYISDTSRKLAGS